MKEKVFLNIKPNGYSSDIIAQALKGTGYRYIEFIDRIVVETNRDRLTKDREGLERLLKDRAYPDSISFMKMNKILKKIFIMNAKIINIEYDFSNVDDYEMKRVLHVLKSIERYTDRDYSPNYILSRLEFLYYELRLSIKSITFKHNNEIITIDNNSVYETSGDEQKAHEIVNQVYLINQG